MPWMQASASSTISAAGCLAIAPSIAVCKKYGNNLSRPGEIVGLFTTIDPFAPECLWLGLQPVIQGLAGNKDSDTDGKIGGAE